MRNWESEVIKTGCLWTCWSSFYLFLSEDELDHHVKEDRRLSSLPVGWWKRAMNSGKWGSKQAVDHWAHQLHLYQTLSLSISDSNTQTHQHSHCTQSISGLISEGGINQSAPRDSTVLLKDSDTSRCFRDLIRKLYLSILAYGDDRALVPCR